MPNIFSANESIPVQTGNLENILGQLGVPQEVAVPSTATLPGGVEAWLSSPTISSPGGANTVFAVNIIQAVPLTLARPTRIDRLGFMLVVNGGAGSVVRLGVYNNDPTTQKPTTLIVDSGSIVADAGAVVAKTATVAAILPPGLNWLVYLAGVGGPAPNIVATPPTAIPWPPILGQNQPNGVGNSGWNVAFTFAQLPQTFPTSGLTVSSATANQPAIWVRAA